jgi:TonB family protein
MKARAATLVLVAAVGWGCGGDKEARRPDSFVEGGPEYKLAAAKRKRAATDPAPGMELRHEVGVLESADVEGTLEKHFDEIRGCYQRAGKAQKYAAGKVLLRFVVAGDGHADDVLVVESDLGNYGVERCLVEVGRRITFRAPDGRRATTFDYPVEFRSTGEKTVLDLDGPKVEHDVSVLMPQLAACGQLSTRSVAAIMYIEPNGFPGSVGLAASTTLDEDVGDCIVQTIRRWKMSTTLPGRVLRCNFSIPPVIATAEPPRRAALSVSSRRRRR